MQLYLRPFYKVFRQQLSFEWTAEHQKRFEEIKTLLTEQLSNTIPDPDQPFYGMCDASIFAINALNPVLHLNAYYAYTIIYEP